MVPGVSKEGASLAGHSALTDLVSSAALLLMLLLRSWLHKPIYKCFIHTLRDINPPLAHQVWDAAFSYLCYLQQIPCKRNNSSRLW